MTTAQRNYLTNEQPLIILESPAILTCADPINGQHPLMANGTCVGLLAEEPARYALAGSEFAHYVAVANQTAGEGA
jgi:hypothetical protein